jgi:hypothetical protein
LTKTASVHIHFFCFWLRGGNLFIVHTFYLIAAPNTAGEFFKAFIRCEVRLLARLQYQQIVQLNKEKYFCATRVKEGL